jgi:putative transposase
MARKRFKPEQIVRILREVERSGTRHDVIRKHGISEQTYYRWKRMYGGLGVSEVKRIKELEKENRRLKELAGEQALAIETLKEYQKERGLL